MWGVSCLEEHKSGLFMWGIACLKSDIQKQYTFLGKTSNFDQPCFQTYPYNTNNAKFFFKDSKIDIIFVVGASLKT